NPPSTSRRGGETVVTAPAGGTAPGSGRRSRGAQGPLPAQLAAGSHRPSPNCRGPRGRASGRTTVLARTPGCAVPRSPTTKQQPWLAACRDGRSARVDARPYSVPRLLDRPRPGGRRGRGSDSRITRRGGLFVVSPPKGANL